MASHQQQTKAQQAQQQKQIQEAALQAQQQVAAAEAAPTGAPTPGAPTPETTPPATTAAESMVPAPHPEWYQTQPRQALTATNRQQCSNSTLCCNVCGNVQTWSPPCHSNISRGASTSLASAPTAELMCSNAGRVVLSRSDAELVRARAVHMRCAESVGEHGRLSTRG